MLILNYFCPVLESLRDLVEISLPGIQFLF